MISCKKKEVPELSTAAVTNITGTSATSGGTITNEGSSSVVSLGVCWSTETGPTINDFKTSEMAGGTEFSSNLKSLANGTKYYIRAYAVNDEGIGYGNEVSFTTLR
jgi:starch-binding outer membrane protein SusE/F